MAGNNNFSYFLKYMLRKQQIAPQALCDALSWSPGYLKHLFDGDYPPPDEARVDRLIDFLKCNPAEAEMLRYFATPEVSFLHLREEMKKKDEEIERLSREVEDARRAAISAAGAPVELADLFGRQDELAKKFTLWLLRTGKIKLLAKLFE